jgi:uncharacterized integral membrane protein
MKSTPTKARPLDESAAGTSAPVPPLAPAGDRRGKRLARHARGARSYAAVGVVVALLVVLVVLASANTHATKLDWVFGSTQASLVWVVLGAAVFGWLLGITTAAVIGRRARRSR